MKTAQIIFLFTLSGLSTLCAVDHSPVWTSQSSLTYNLRDLDNFAPLGYSYTRWGNIMDEVSSSFFDPTNKWLDFTPLTKQHLSSNTDQDTWDLFLSGGSGSANTLYRYLFPADPFIWNWENYEVGFRASGSYTLFRYLHFDSIPKDPDGVELPSGKNKLIILIHGWNPEGNTDPYADNEAATDEGSEFISLYENLTNATTSSDWTVFKYNWAADADTGDFIFSGVDATQAAEHGHQHGQHLGDTIYFRNPNVTNVHLIAHSAGSWVARGTARNLLDMNPNIRVQVTFLDPFMPNTTGTNSSLGQPIMSALDETFGNTTYLLENYFSDDLFVPGTQEQFAWNTNRGDINARTNVTSAPLKYGGHSGPIQWYADTIDDATNGLMQDLLNFDLATYGWRRSMFYNEPIINFTPEPIEVNIGSAALLTAEATTRDRVRFHGDSLSPEILYLWLKAEESEWRVLENQNSNTLRFIEFSEEDAGIYIMAAVNLAGIATTNLIEVSAITFANWVSQYPDIPISQQDAEDDFDQDGFSNLLEYALGTDPTAHGEAPDIDFQLADGKLSLSYDRLRGDLTYTVEASLDLAAWDTVNVNQGGSGFGRITAWILKANEPRQFLQLRVEPKQP